MTAGKRDFGRVGVIGAGHLGATLALEILKHGLPPERLLISTGGSPGSAERLRVTGLGANITTNEQIAASCPFVFATLRPSGWDFLTKLEFTENVTIISTIAGVSASRLGALTGRRCVHAMPSGPDTISSGNGLCAIFPSEPTVSGLLRAIGMQVVPLTSEEEMQEFTAAVCLPAVAVAAQSMGIDLEAQWGDAQRLFPSLASTIHWARTAAPELSREIDRQAYIGRMATKGGITEIIIESFRAGQSMSQSLVKGVARCREIAQSSR